MVPPQKTLLYRPPKSFFHCQCVVLADITPVILTYNEAANIGRSLERLTWAGQVVIVDSGSTDDTLAIVARFPNVRIVQRPFDTHAQQWRFAVEETGITSDWLLRLDADYMVEPALRDEMAALAPAPGDGGVRDRLHLLHRRPAVASLALSGAAGSVPPRPRPLRAGWPHREAAHRRARRTHRQPPAARRSQEPGALAAVAVALPGPGGREARDTAVVGAELARSPAGVRASWGHSPSRCTACL